MLPKKDAKHSSSAQLPRPPEIEGQNVVCWSRYLKIASHGPFRLAASLNLEQLSTCRQLEELFLGGFRGRDLESFCQRSCRSLWFHEQRWGTYMGVVVTDDMVDILDGMML